MNKVWYSAATDVTGKALMAALGLPGSKDRPTGAKSILCWGTKIKKDTTFPAGVKVFNNPNNIRKNRNKLTALESMDGSGCAVADFTGDFTKAGKGKFAYPLIARTKYHQGGAGFWLCLNASQTKRAQAEGAEYIQAFLDIENEYRLHVVDGKVIYAVKKVARDTDDLDPAFKEYWKGHVQNFAAKKEEELDEKTLDLVISRFSRKMATGVDMVVRSNTKGWKFSRVTLDKVPENLANEAIKAVKSLGLDFGAVDCCIDVKKKAWVIECNTGPGLEGSSLEAWVKALKDLLSGKTKKVAATADKVATATTGKAALREKLKGQAEFMSAMVEAADDTELEAMGSLFNKMGVSK